MAYRDSRGTRTALFDDLEDGGARVASSFYSSNEIAEVENEQALGELQDRVKLLKMLSSDVNNEVQTHNRLLDRLGIDMEVSRGTMSGVVDRMTAVFSTKSSRKIVTISASFVCLLLLAYFLTK